MSLNKQASLTEAIRRAVIHAGILEDSDQVTKEQTEVRLNQLNRQYDDYLVVQDAIEEACGADELKLQFVYRSQVEEYYYTAVCNDNQIKLPTITLPIFGGRYEDWPSFLDLFTSLIHNKTTLSGAQKLHYLKSNLSGEALQLLKSFQITDVNYIEAWNLLNSRYNNKHFIVNAHLNTLMCIPNASSESPSCIKRILDTALESIRALTALELPVNHWDAILVHIIVNKLDFETHRQWELSLNRQNCFPSFKDLFDFLELRWQSLEMVPVQKTKTINHQRTTFEIVTKSFHGTPTLINCAENHELYKCPKYLKMNYDERTQCVQKFNLCFNCLRNGHSSAKCRYGQCKICS